MHFPAVGLITFGFGSANQKAYIECVPKTTKSSKLCVYIVYSSVCIHMENVGYKFSGKARLLYTLLYELHIQHVCIFRQYAVSEIISSSKLCIVC